MSIELPEKINSPRNRQVQKAPDPKVPIVALLLQYRAVLVVIILLLLPIFVPPWGRYEIGLWATTAIMGLSVVAVTGASGQVSLGQAGLMAVGAYGSAISTSKLNLPQPLPLLVALAGATLVGTLLAYACLRLSGLYLAVVTLAFGWAVPELALYFDSATNGYQGLFPGGIEIAGYSITSGLAGVYFALTGLIIAYLIVNNLLNGWSRLNVTAVKQSEILARSFGVIPARQRVWAFAVSSLLAGLSGYIYTYTVGAVTPTSFDFDSSVAFLAAAVIGGMVSPIGALIGAAFVSAVPNLLASNAETASLIYGALLFLVLIVRSRISKVRTTARSNRRAS